jgi:hypothetical protein
VDLGDLKIGQIVSNKALRTTFHVGVHGGIRLSKRLTALVVVADFYNPLYSNRWVGNTLEFEAVGKRGHVLRDYRNRALAESIRTSTPIYLFDKYSPDANIYQGRAQVLGGPKKARVKGVDGDSHSTYIFRLRPLHRVVLPDDYLPIVELEVLLHEEKEDWPEYFMQRVRQGVRLPRIHQSRVEIVFDALWREYAASRTEAFLQAFDAAASNRPYIVAPYYDLERGSIVSRVSVGIKIVAYCTMFGAYYPQARDNAPEIARDILQVAQSTIITVKAKLGKIQMHLPPPAPPWEQVPKPIVGPASEPFRPRPRGPLRS